MTAGWLALSKARIMRIFRDFCVNYTGMAPGQKERDQFSHKVTWISAVTSSRTRNEKKKNETAEIQAILQEDCNPFFDTNAPLLDNQLVRLNLGSTAFFPFSST